LEIAKIPFLYFNEVHSLHVILEELSRVEIDSSISLMDYSLWNEKCNVFHWEWSFIFGKILL